MTSTNHHKGRVETLQCAGEVSKRRAAGESLRWIYRDLRERGALSVTYNTFMRWARRIEAGELSVPANRQEQREPVRVRSESTKLPTRTAPGEHSDAQAYSANPKYIRMTNPIPPAPDSEPDLKALFGENE